jgi:hypothetical protein
VHTEQQHFTSHNEVPMFISRAIYQISECKRRLSGSKQMLTRAATSINFSVLERAPATGDVEQLLGSGQELDAPRGVHNVGNTCFMNAFVQCCRRLVLKVPLHLLPSSDQCPLACMLLPEATSAEKNSQWSCGTSLPIGPQRDVCEVLEMRFDPNSLLHSSCPVGECYGVVFRNLTIFSQERHVFCNHCAYTHSETQTQCFMRVEPQINAEASISQCLQDTDIPEFK